LLVALGLAVLVWLYARSRDQELLDNVPVPVEIRLAPGQAEQFDLEVTGPAQVPVSFRGPPSRIRELRGCLQRGELHVAVTVVVPEDRREDASYRDTVRVDAADVHTPPGVTPLVVEGRNRVPITMHRLVERQLPVRLDPAPEERVSEVSVEPARVRVRGPQDILDRARAIPTQAYLLPPPGEAGAGQDLVVGGPVALVQELGGRPVRASPSAVTVRLTLRPRQKLYEVANVPVRFLCPADFALRPHFVDERGGRVTVRFWGPVADVPPPVAAYVDLSGRKLAPGLYADEPVRVQLPPDAQLVPGPYRSAMFRLVPADDHTNPKR
jgi:hypothetical protein